MFKLIPNGTLNQLLLIYLIQLITLIFLLRKYKKSTFYILIILLFYQSIFSFLGKEVENGYKIVVLFITIWVSINRKVFVNFKKGDLLVTLFFVCFSLIFDSTFFSNTDTLFIFLSQYSRYFIAFCLWFIVRNELYRQNSNLEEFKKLIYELILMQIIISVGKLIIYEGEQFEFLVGSLAHIGGSLGTTLPILSFIMLWFYKRGVFNSMDWLFVVGIMLIGFLAGKRAIWFIMPLVMAAFMIFVPKLKMNKALWIAIIITPLAFYLGVRISPSLNPEKRVWGSFDFEYAVDFADKYQFGDEERMKYDKRAQGRGGATSLIWEKWISDEKLTEKDLYGIGLSSMYTGSYEDFNKQDFGVAGKGDATGFFQTYITAGYLGVITTVLFFFYMLWQIKMKRIRWVLIGIVAWEYFMYVGNFFRTPALMFLIVYFIHYSNYLTISSVKVKPSGLFVKKKPLNLMIFKNEHCRI